MLALVGTLAADAAIAESANRESLPLPINPLEAPPGFHGNRADPDTAFREEEAGISAYKRIEEQDSSDDARIDIAAVVKKLKAAPTEPDVRGAGAVVDYGLNFAIVELPMFAADIDSAPQENVTVYFDDHGWIVAYLPPDRPGAAMWKHTATDEGGVGDSAQGERFERNLLVLAVNEVMAAHDPTGQEVTHDDVSYYDWQYPECNAFVLFSMSTEGGKSDPVKFVIPKTIGDIQASAAILITEQTEDGSEASATLFVDGDSIIAAGADQRLRVSNFALGRDRDGTSLHRAYVESTDNEAAAGAIMLLYEKP